MIGFIEFIWFLEIPQHALFLLS